MFSGAQLEADGLVLRRQEHEQCYQVGACGMDNQTGPSGLHERCHDVGYHENCLRAGCQIGHHGYFC